MVGCSKIISKNSGQGGGHATTQRQSTSEVAATVRYNLNAGDSPHAVEQSSPLEELNMCSPTVPMGVNCAQGQTLLSTHEAEKH